MVKVHQLVAAIATTITLSTSSAYALNMGSISWKSSYGQPLDARIELSDAKDLQASDIKSSIANSNDFSKAGLEYSPTLSNLSFTTTVNPDGTGYIRISSTTPIKEPFMNFLVDVNWPNGKISKEYTILLDIPESKTAATTAPKANNATKSTVSNTSAVNTPSQVANGYKTKRGDTLWSIAQANYGQALTAKASKAIFEKNPKAFINGNINSLLNGYTLNMPTKQEVNAISVAQANAFLGSPSKDVATATPKKSIPDKQEQALQDQLRNSAQELESARSENTELNTELENIESEIARLEQISKDKDEAIAKAEQAKLLAKQTTQQEIQTPKEQVTTTQPAIEQHTNQTPVETKSQEQATTQPTELKVAQTPTASEPQAQTPKANTAPVSTPAKAPAQPPVEDTSPSFISSLLDNNMMLLAGGGVLLLLCIAVIISRRKKAVDDAQVVDLSNVVLDDEDLKDSTPDDTASATKDVVSPLSQLGEGMGIIDKADIYLAYNHVDEAKELLLNALQEDPTNTELRLKLMEIYADKGDADSFEKEEQELLLLDPLAQHKIDTIKEKYPTLLNDFNFSNNPTSIKEQNETFTSFKQDAEENTKDKTSEEPEFNFDYADFAEPAIATTVKETELEPVESEIPVKRLEEDVANFKLEKITPETQHASSPLFNAIVEEDFSSDSPTTIFEKEEDNESKESNEGIKFDLGVGDQKSDNVDYISQLENKDLDDDIIEKDQVTTKLELVHAYIDMGDTEGAHDLLKEIIQEGNETQKNEAQSLLASLNITPSVYSDSNESTHIAQESTVHDLFNSVDHANTTLTELELGFELPPEDEVSTKLELANAYIEMGDKQGAKDILDEVLHEGNADQKLKAQDLLKSIS